MPLAPVKISVNIPFPEKSTGRLLDSLTDIIRPFTEARGLRADQIRLQRADVALKIVKTAAKKIQHEKSEYHEIPTKGLIPFLEKASLEQPSDRQMISMWANLLVSTATTEFSNLARYTSILSEMNHHQAKLLEWIIYNGKRRQQILTPQTVEDSNYGSQTFVVSKMQRNKSSAKEFLDFVVDALDVPGHALKYADTVDLKDDKVWSWPSGKKIGKTVWRDHDELDYNILRSLGLVDRTNIHLFSKNYELDTTYYWVTRMGYDLFLQCNPDIRLRWKQLGWPSVD